MENGKGLNLTFEVRDGILNHLKGPTNIFEQGQAAGPKTLEAEIVRISDSIAYINHDIDDAIRSGLITEAHLPAECVAVLGDKPSHRIDTMVADVIESSRDAPIQMSPRILEATNVLRNYLYEHVYPRHEIQDSINKGKKILREIYKYLVANPDIFLKEAPAEDPSESIERLVVDFVAGMTDRYALDFYAKNFLPKIEL